MLAVLWSAVGQRGVLGQLPPAEPASREGQRGAALLVEGQHAPPGQARVLQPVALGAAAHGVVPAAAQLGLHLRHGTRGARVQLLVSSAMSVITGLP